MDKEAKLFLTVTISVVELNKSIDMYDLTKKVVTGKDAEDSESSEEEVRGTQLLSAAKLLLDANQAVESAPIDCRESGLLNRQNSEFQSFAPKTQPI